MTSLAILAWRTNNGLSTINTRKLLDSLCLVEPSQDAHYLDFGVWQQHLSLIMPMPVTGCEVHFVFSKEKVTIGWLAPTTHIPI